MRTELPTMGVYPPIFEIRSLRLSSLTGTPKWYTKSTQSRDAYNLMIRQITTRKVSHRFPTQAPLEWQGDKKHDKSKSRGTRDHGDTSGPALAHLLASHV